MFYQKHHKQVTHVLKLNKKNGILLFDILE